ncbi:unnamed protein product [Candidatus Paraburkholderia kirkii UZHbot1]|uniref:WGS project CAFE00000000 data, contig bkir_c189 n=1 Tax=Candidatus Paraburkholderia kirkii UZHbot1 TaxID=1055526 RepID=U3UAN8_9BURK|nr:unnamed protein product [Candidatus Paraburkholderia kirkii UZHbot1]
MRSACTPLSAMRTPASDSVTRSPEGDVGGVSAGVEIDVKAGSSSRRAMTHAASAVTARGLALAGAAPANFLRHNPKSADSCSGLPNLDTSKGRLPRPSEVSNGQKRVFRGIQA